MDYFVANYYTTVQDKIEIDISEVLRYMGSKKDCCTSTKTLIKACIKEIDKKLNLKLSYMLLPCKINENHIDFDLFSVDNEYLAKNLMGCENAILFGATIGQELDRKILKNSLLNPSVALCFQALGTEYIEKFCDSFEDFIKNTLNTNIKPRFSPGYADFSLDYQNKFFDILKLTKNCGMTLSENLIMRPSKSVTAIMGLTKESCNKKTGCETCNSKTCQYRKL